MRAAMLMFACTVAFDAAATRRAVLIGINDYGAAQKTNAGRDWTDLSGAVNDAGAFREALILLYGFRPEDIVTLTDRRATRAAVLQSIGQHLVQPAQRDDILLFYFAGHGSQVRNSASDEADRMDESIVPADGRDIRDKELRPLFNAIVDRGARLTIVLDNCNSGSGARGGLVSRGVAPDLRDVADRSDYGPRPEERGALIFAAAQDFDQAWETRDEQKRIRGAFSLALLRAMRDASANESASDVFLRAQARLRGDVPFQAPVLSGNASARLAPFLGAEAAGRRLISRRDGDVPSVVFVEKVRRDGMVLVQGGRAHGLMVGSELRGVASRLRVTAIKGIDRSEARLESGSAVLPGAMLEIRGKRDPLERQPSPPPQYRLALRCARGGELAASVLGGGEEYELVLRRAASNVKPRFVYVYVVDSEGRSVLLFPRNGSVENRFPLALPAPAEIRLDARFAIAAPYGVDTFFLLIADEPLADPWILESEGIHRRGSPSPMPAAWSLERVVYRSERKIRHKCPSVVSEDVASSPGSDSPAIRHTPSTLSGASPGARRPHPEG